MQVQSRLIETTVPRAPQGAVLVLHGGASRRGATAVSPTQLSVLRMIPIAHRVARAGRDRLAVFRLLNSVRGWDTSHTPVDDVRWALGELRERFGAVPPTALVGHSLGGRAALLAGDAPEVRSVVALAPWVYPGDAAGRLADRQVLVVHGTDDRVASPRNSAAMVRGLSPAARVGYLSIAGGKHAMLSHGEQFERAAADFTTATLLGDAVDGPVGEVLAGAEWIDA